MTSKSRRLIPLLQLTIIAIKTNKRLYLIITLSIISIAFLLIKSLGLDSVASGIANPLMKYDREREAGDLVGNVHFPALKELIERDRLWPPDLDKPLCDLKIYVYQLPESLSLTSDQIKQCRWSAYSSELVLHSLLTSPSTNISSTYVTTNPEEADIFFIPLFPACYLFNCWVKAGWNRKLRCGVDEDYIQPVMKHVKSQPWWSKKQGSNHLIVHPMDHIDSYYTEQSRLEMNSSIYLVTVGDLRPKPYSIHFRRYRDIVIPSSTHLLNSYRINPRDYLNDQGFPLQSRIIPKDEPTKAIIWESSSSEEKSVWKKGSDYLKSSNLLPISKRTTTAIFRGGVGNPVEDGEAYSLSIRTLFFPTDSSFTPPEQSHSGFSSLPGYDIASSSENVDYAIALSKSKFGLVPPGWTLDTTRLYEYLAFGIVPVFIGTGNKAGQVLPFENDFDYSSFSIFIPRSQAHLLPTILASILDEEYERLRKNVWDIGRLLVLEEGKGNVWNWISRDLCRFSGKGMGAGSNSDWF